jgi:hypothetical protein
MAEIKAEGTEAKAVKITQQPASPPPVDPIIQYLTEATPINEGQKRFQVLARRRSFRGRHFSNKKIR